ncbi:MULTISPECIES: hypothetical protein [Bacillaceae]|uniref:hypothetical protein n=1 Tax=Bacillaceae TaxID=186817 RepID=UPI002963F60D|nr:hypothetical protein [Bacillus infantis]MDW2876409.1 hypothetical protein [Bacillus infantis]
MKKKSPYKLMMINMFVFTMILVNLAIWPLIFSHFDNKENTGKTTEAGAISGPAEIDAVSESPADSESNEDSEPTEPSGSQEKSEDLFKIVEIK